MTCTLSRKRRNSFSNDNYRTPLEHCLGTNIPDSEAHTLPASASVSRRKSRAPAPPSYLRTRRDLFQNAIDVTPLWLEDVLAGIALMIAGVVWGILILALVA